MSEMNVQRAGPETVLGTPAIADDRSRSGSDRQDDGEDARAARDGAREGGRAGGRKGGHEELAVALDEPGRELRAELCVGTDGEPLVRIVDVRRNEVVATLRPDELRLMAEATWLPLGLPAGLLFQVRS